MSCRITTAFDGFKDDLIVCIRALYFGDARAMLR